MQKSQGQWSAGLIDRVETNDRKMDTTNFISFFANAVGNNLSTWIKDQLFALKNTANQLDRLLLL